MTTPGAMSPGTYVVDPASSRIGFEAKLGLGLKARGWFDRYTSLIDVRDSPADSSLSLTVWTESVRTGIRMRDSHLRAGKVFAVDDFPTLDFRSTRIVEAGTGFHVEGVLRVRDVSRPVAFHAVPAGLPDQARYTTELTVAPGAFGITRHGTTKPLKVLLDVTLTPGT